MIGPTALLVKDKSNSIDRLDCEFKIEVRYANCQRKKKTTRHDPSTATKVVAKSDRKPKGSVLVGGLNFV